MLHVDGRRAAHRLVQDTYGRLADSRPSKLKEARRGVAAKGGPCSVIGKKHGRSPLGSSRGKAEPRNGIVPCVARRVRAPGGVKSKVGRRTHDIVSQRIRATGTPKDAADVV